MEPITKLTPLAPLKPLNDEKLQEDGLIIGEESLFGSIFRSAINNVKETDADRVETQYLLATGQLDNPAALMIAASKNQIAVDLLIQLRNKALDVYSELTRISL